MIVETLLGLWLAIHEGTPVMCLFDAAVSVVRTRVLVDDPAFLGPCTAAFEYDKRSKTIVLTGKLYTVKIIVPENTKTGHVHYKWGDQTATFHDNRREYQVYVQIHLNNGI
jgi:hypothetical protein